MSNRSKTIVLSSLVALMAAAGSLAAAQPKAPALSYTADGRLVFPKDYRSWVYLSTGIDMSYAELPASVGDGHVFDSVFVNREAYEAFQKTGTWPDKTVMVLEVRMGQTKGSINHRGAFQTNRVAMEVHVKDVKRFPKDGWAFFPVRGEEGGKPLPETSDCNVCHEQHGAVDTTFVQFYPTLMPKAQEMKTLAASYLAEEQAKAQGK